MIDDLRIYSKKLEYTDLHPIISYPNCPSYCPTDCEFVKSGRIICKTCLGNRIKSGIKCTCPLGYIEIDESQDCQKCINIIT